MDVLFRSVFNNIYLSKLIYNYSRLYKKNEKVVFWDKVTLLEYQEKEFIKSLDYQRSLMLDIGDLPFNGVLKELNFGCNELSLIKGDCIPWDIEKLSFCDVHRSDTITTPLSTLPNTIHTVENVVILSTLLKPPHIIDDNIDSSTFNEYYKIPSNITSLSFRECTNISNNDDNGNGSIKIPSTIKKLSFFPDWNNEFIKLRIGDIPDSVNDLDINGIDITTIDKNVLPNSINQLQISIDNQRYPHTNILTNNNNNNNNNTETLFNFLPSNIEILDLSTDISITLNLNLFNYTTIKEMLIYFDKSIQDITIEPNSLPSSITKLTLSTIINPIKENSIPQSVQYLKLIISNDNEIDDKIITEHSIPNNVKSLSINKFIKPNLLPCSLTYLEIDNQYITDEDYDLHSMLTNLLSSSSHLHSLISIKLPESFKDLNNFIYPTSIKKVNYFIYRKKKKFKY